MTTLRVESRQSAPTAPTFNPPHLHLAPPLGGVTPFEFADLRIRKLRFSGPSCGVVSVILHIAVLVEHRLVTDGQTARQTHDDS